VDGEARLLQHLPAGEFEVVHSSLSLVGDRDAGGGATACGLEIHGPSYDAPDVSNIERIQNELEGLSLSELRQIRELLDEMLEDDREFTPEFEAAIEESEREMAKGLRPRIRKP
jgi:hypothetical protein